MYYMLHVTIHKFILNLSNPTHLAGLLGLESPIPRPLLIKEKTTKITSMPQVGLKQSERNV
jgi:hypothetical protein